MVETTDNKRWWKPLIIFFVEVVVGSIIFILIATFAVGLNYLVHWLTEQGIDSIIITGLTVLEYTIFTVDVALCIFYIIKSAIKAGKEL